MFLNLFIFSIAFRLRKKLSDFGVEAILKNEPITTLKKSKKDTSLKKDIASLSFEKRLALCLEKHGVNFENLLLYLSCFPEKTGKERQRIFENTLQNLDFFSKETSDFERKENLNILKAFHLLTKKDIEQRAFAQNFETFSLEHSDFRLEAATLERFHDFFYEEENISVLLPDWTNTTKDKLIQQENLDSLRLISEAQDKQAVTRLLLKAMLSLFFKEGLVFLPCPASCKLDKKEGLIFTRAPFSFRASFKERTQAFLTLESFLKKEEKKEPFFAFIKERIFSYSFILRSFFLSLHQLNLFCEETLCLKNFFDDILKEVFEETPSLRPKQTFSYRQSDSIKNAFQASPSQEERLHYTKKRLPCFHKNLYEIGNILERQTVKSRLFSKKKYPFHFLFFILVFLILIYLSGLLGIL